MRAGVAHNTGASDQARQQQHASEARAEQTGDGGATDTEPRHFHGKTKVILNDILRTLELARRIFARCLLDVLRNNGPLPSKRSPSDFRLIDPQGSFLKLDPVLLKRNYSDKVL